MVEWKTDELKVSDRKTRKIITIIIVIITIIITNITINIIIINIIIIIIIIIKRPLSKSLEPTILSPPGGSQMD